MKLVMMCGKRHDRKVKRWRRRWNGSIENCLILSKHGRKPFIWGETSSSESQGDVCSPLLKSFIIVGDNIDRTIRSRDMRVDHQTQSLLYLNSYCALDRVDLTGISIHSNCKLLGDIMSIPTSAFLPTVEDCTQLKDNYIVLVAGNSC